MEDSLLGDLIYDLKGKKHKRLDWIEIANKCQQVVDLYGSVQEAADKLTVSASLLNSILRLKRLDPRVQEMIRKREILFDSAQRLNTIQPSEHQYEIAKMIANVSTRSNVKSSSRRRIFQVRIW